MSFDVFFHVRMGLELGGRITVVLILVLFAYYLYHIISETTQPGYNIYGVINGFQTYAVYPKHIPHVCEVEGTRLIPFTQGLLFSNDDTVLESSGLSGSSFLREFDAYTGKTKRVVKLPSPYFAEGCAMVVEPSTLKLFVMLLTYTDKVILLYDYETFELAYTFKVGYTGFGLTSNYNFKTTDLKEFIRDQKVWMTTSDENMISVEIPYSFSKGQLTYKYAVKITLNGKPLAHVNELEYKHSSGTIYGNIWLTNYIVEINPWNGSCLNVWDLSSLADEQQSSVDVLNGIACHPQRDDILVTGKLWPQMYYVKLSTNNAIPSATANTIADRIQLMKKLIKH